PEDGSEVGFDHCRVLFHNYRGRAKKIRAASRNDLRGSSVHQPLGKNSLNVAIAMQNADDLQRFRVWAVYDQIRVDCKESYRSRGEITAPVTSDRKTSEKRDFLADNGFNSICCLLAALSFQVMPDFRQIAGGLRGKDVPFHSGRVFSRSR